MVLWPASLRGSFLALAVLVLLGGSAATVLTVDPSATLHPSSGGTAAVPTPTSAPSPRAPSAAPPASPPSAPGKTQPSVSCYDCVTSTVRVGTSPDGAVVDPAHREVFVPNYGSNNVSVISETTDQVVASIPVGTNPCYPAYDAGMGEVFVPNCGSGTVSVINTTARAVIATVTVGSQPRSAAYDSAKAEVFVSNLGDGTVSVISDASNTVVATVTGLTSPLGLAYDAAQGEVWVANNGCAGNCGTVSAISDSTNSVVVSNIPASAATRVLFDPGKNELFVADGYAVTVISTLSNTVVDTIAYPSGDTSYGAAYDPAQGTILDSVVGPSVNQLWQINDTTNTIGATIPVGNTPNQPAFDPALLEAFVPDYGSNAVSVVSTEVATIGLVTRPATCGTVTIAGMSYTNGASVPVGSGPYTPTLSACPGYVIEGLSASGGVTVFPTNGTFTVGGRGTLVATFIPVPRGTSQVVGTVGVGVNPRAVAYDSGKGEIFVADYYSASVSVVSATTQSVLATIPVGGLPWGVAYDPTQGTVFVALANQVVGYGRVVVVSDTTNTVVGSIATGENPRGMVWDSGTQQMFVVNDGGNLGALGNNVSVVAGATDAIVATIPVGTGGAVSPQGAAYDPGLGEVFVGMGYNSNQIEVLSDSTDAVVGSVSISNGACGPYCDPFSLVYVGTTNTLYAWTLTSQLGLVSPATNSVTSFLAVGTVNLTGPDQIAYDPASGDVYAANSQTDTLSVISTASNTVVGTVPDAVAPDGIVYAPSVGELFVANAYSSSLTALSDGTLAVSVSSRPSTCGYAIVDGQDLGTGGLVYGTVDGTNAVDVLSPSSDAVLATVPVGASPGVGAVDPLNGEVFVVNYGSSNVSVLSGTSVVATIPLPSGPAWATYDTVNGEMYVSDLLSSEVSAIDPATDTVVATIPVGNAVTGLAFDPYNGEVFAADYGSDQISVINGATNTVVNTFGAGPQPGGLAFDPVRDELFVTNDGYPGSPGNTVSVYYAPTDAFLTNIVVGSRPLWVVFDPANELLYALNSNSGSVSVISDLTDAVVATIPLGTATGNWGSLSLDPVNGDLYVASGTASSLVVISTATDAILATSNGFNELNSVGYAGATEASAWIPYGTYPVAPEACPGSTLLGVSASGPLSWYSTNSSVSVGGAGALVLTFSAPAGAAPLASDAPPSAPSMTSSADGMASWVPASSLTVPPRNNRGAP